MEAARWEQVRSILANAWRCQDTNEQNAYLNGACGDDHELRVEIDSLLDAEEDSEGFLDRPVTLEAATLADASRGGVMSGERIGPWRIERMLAAGGMGEVYQVRREEADFEQCAALKLMRLSVATEEALRRFEQERRILARLDHPDIARFLDGGTTGDGCPYFVMEYIPGLPLDRWCDAHQLDIDGRIQLFERICQAVQFAHQNLIIHRDLKPTNILVTEDGAPKLLDFGIAKLLEPDSDGELTATLARRMTPDYASPEQVSGEPITTASDIYSLGVLLFRLLAGAKPYRVQTTDPYKLEEVIVRQAPSSPSQALRSLSKHEQRTIAAARSVRPERLHKYLQGDLDIILMKALQKEPQRRYPTALSLAQDLKRHREHLPIAARRDSLAYRSTRFVKRHTAGVAAAAAVLLALTGGLGAALWQAHVADTEREHAEAARQRAEARFNDVRHLANALLFELHDAIAALPGSTHARRLLVDEALVYLQQLSRQAQGDWQLQRELAEAYMRVGDVLGEPNSSSLGDLKGARESYQHGLELREALLERDPNDPRALHEYANALDQIGVAIWWGGDTTGALEHHRKALAARKKVLAMEPESTQFQTGLANTARALADVLAWNSELDEALVHYERSVEILSRTLEQDPENVEVLRGLAGTLTNRGYALSWVDSKKALPDFRRAHDLLAKAQGQEPGNTAVGLSSLRVYIREGEALSDLERYEEALAAFQRAVVDSTRMFEADLRNAEVERLLALAHAKVGDVLRDTDRLDAAAMHYESSLARYRALAAAQPENYTARESLTNAYRRMGWLKTLEKQYDQAMMHYHKALAMRRQLYERDPADTMAQRNVAVALADLGDTEFLRGESLPQDAQAKLSAWQSASGYYRKSLADWQQLIDADALMPADETVVDDIKKRMGIINAFLAAIVDTHSG